MVMDEQTYARASGERPKPSLARRIASLTALGALIYAASQGIAGSCADQDAIDRAGARFLAALGRDDVHAAYDQLSSRRRASMAFEAFAALTDHPALRRHDSDVSFGKQESRPDGVCRLGSLSAEGGEWAIQLFFVEEADGWHVHSFGLQAPATMQLGTLLEECGYWEGTRMGYSGPPVEHVTPPTSEEVEP
jgi:hypothetical protein